MFGVNRLRSSVSVASRFHKKMGSVRNGGTWVYRSAAVPASKGVLLKAELVGAAMWYWVLWHFWHQPEHIVGHFPYPDPSKWTDEELGIPPDDAE